MDPNLLQFAWFSCKQHRKAKHVLQYTNDLYLVDLVCVYEDIAKKERRPKTKFTTLNKIKNIISSGNELSRH